MSPPLRALRGNGGGDTFLMNLLAVRGRFSKPPPFPNSRTAKLFKTEWLAGCEHVGRLRFVVHRSPIAKRRFVLLEHRPLNLNLSFLRHR